VSAADAPPEIRTRAARALWDEHLFRGHRVYADLLGRTSTTGLVALALTGERLSADDCAFVDEIFTAVAFADPRVWPLKISRIVASYGRFVPALVAGYLSIDIDGECIGPGVCTMVSEQLREIFERVRGRVDDPDAVGEAVRERLARGAKIQGFGVPLRPHDERVAALRRCLVARGRDRGPYWRLFESMVPVLRREKKLEPNIGAALTAVLLDLGLDGQALRAVAMMSALSTFLANAVEGASEPAACLRVLPGDCIEYAGAPPRESPRARARRERG
jgi:hypothetical protein